LILDWVEKNGPLARRPRKTGFGTRLIDLVIERHRDLLRRGTVLVDERDAGTEPRMLFYLEHAIQDASITRSASARIG